METVVMTQGNMSFIPKQIIPEQKRILNNDFFISLTKEIRAGLKTPPVSRKEVLAAIKSGNVSPDVVEEMEDAILGQMMNDALNSESVSIEEIFRELRK